jgi:hypothetical protein
LEKSRKNPWMIGMDDVDHLISSNFFF